MRLELNETQTQNLRNMVATARTKYAECIALAGSMTAEPEPYWQGLAAQFGKQVAECDAMLAAIDAANTEG